MLTEALSLCNGMFSIVAQFYMLWNTVSHADCTHSFLKLHKIFLHRLILSVDSFLRRKGQHILSVAVYFRTGPGTNNRKTLSGKGGP